MEKLDEVWDNYEIKRKRMFRGKKCLMCESETGEYYGIGVTKCKEGRLYRERFVKEYLQNNGYERVDQLVYNKSEKLFTQDRYHTPYVVRSFFVGSELDVASLSEVKQGAKELARLHQASNGMFQWLCDEEKKLWQKRRARWEADWAEAELEEDDEKQERLKKSLQMRFVPDQFQIPYENVVPLAGDDWLMKQFQKKNRELKRVGDYIQKSTRQSAFIDAYNQCAFMFVKEGTTCVSVLRKVYEENAGLRTELKQGFVHGNYQHHNILKDDAGWALIGFENFRFGPQISDVYDYMRKILEKNEYDFDFAKAILEGYETFVSLTRQDYLCLYLLMYYPDKFWKISNRYYNAKKTWIAPKMIEKLGNVVTQNQQKKEFLVKFREDYLDWLR